ncbi:hypothetical protein CAAN1_02S07492 [[Candida] anglica]|uniref:Retrograde transport protein Dsl1 C-terminal domain-containing protein n=1 Tax=[Candida] anglica TaxID=148631 RepID=A0ABP0EER2_9ASCO
MSIADLLTPYKSQVGEIATEIDNYSLSVNELEVRHDPDFKATETTKTIKNDDQEEVNVKSLSLAQLNAKAKGLDSNLNSLNKLWLIRGLLKEIELTLSPPGSAIDYLCGSSELESVFFNLEKLELKLSQFRESYPSALIVDTLYQHHAKLYNEGIQQIESLFHLFFPNSQTFVNPIIVNGFEFEYNGEFVGVFKNYSNLDTTNQSVISNLIHTKQFVWDKELLDPFLINNKSQLELVQDIKETSEGTSYIYKLTPSSSSISSKDFFDLSYFDSLTNFIRFINLFQDQSLQNFYSSKISRNLTEIVSKNINKLIAGGDLVHRLMDLIDLSKRTNWSLSIASSLNSKDDSNTLADRLNDLYLDWLLDNKIEEIRKFFGDEENVKQLFSNVKDIEYENKDQNDTEKVNHTENEEVADWNDDWDNDAWNEEIDLDLNDDIEEDILNEDWGFSDEEEEQQQHQSKKEFNAKSPMKKRKSVQSLKKSVTSPINSFKTTSVPQLLVKIIDEFIQEGKLKDEIKTMQSVPLLLTTTISFSILTYPSLERSFMLFNDVSYLHQLLLPIVPEEYLSELSEFTSTSWKKLIFDLLPTIATITNSINLKHDDYIAKEMDEYSFELDQETIIQLDSIQSWFDKLLESSNLGVENSQKFKSLVVYFINYVNNWIIDNITSMEEITEYQSTKLSKIIESLQNICIPIAISSVDKGANQSIKSFHKLENTLYLITNHLKDIMERFYSGEFYDYNTNELISIIRSTFVQSELREGYIQEILDIRNVDNE